MCFISVGQPSQAQRYQKLKQYREMPHSSHVETSNVHRASQPCCKNSSGILSNNADHEAEFKCYIASRITWLPFSSDLTFNQLPLSPEDLTPDIGRSSAEPTHTVIPSFILRLYIHVFIGSHLLLLLATWQCKVNNNV